MVDAVVVRTKGIIKAVIPPFAYLEELSDESEKLSVVRTLLLTRATTVLNAQLLVGKAVRVVGQINRQNHNVDIDDLKSLHKTNVERILGDSAKLLDDMVTVGPPSGRLELDAERSELSTTISPSSRASVSTETDEYTTIAHLLLASRTVESSNDLQDLMTKLSEVNEQAFTQFDQIECAIDSLNTSEALDLSEYEINRLKLIAWLRGNHQIHNRELHELFLTFLNHNVHENSTTVCGLCLSHKVAEPTFVYQNSAVVSFRDSVLSCSFADMRGVARQISATAKSTHNCPIYTCQILCDNCIQQFLNPWSRNFVRLLDQVLQSKTLGISAEEEELAIRVSNSALYSVLLDTWLTLVSLESNDFKPTLTSNIQSYLWTKMCATQDMQKLFNEPNIDIETSPTALLYIERPGRHIPGNNIVSQLEDSAYDPLLVQAAWTECLYKPWVDTMSLPATFFGLEEEHAPVDTFIFHRGSPARGWNLVFLPVVDETSFEIPKEALENLKIQGLIPLLEETQSLNLPKDRLSQWLQYTSQVGDTTRNLLPQLPTLVSHVMSKQFLYRYRSYTQCAWNKNEASLTASFLSYAASLSSTSRSLVALPRNWRYDRQSMKVYPPSDNSNRFWIALRTEYLDSSEAMQAAIGLSYQQWWVECDLTDANKPSIRYFKLEHIHSFSSRCGINTECDVVVFMHCPSHIPCLEAGTGHLCASDPEIRKRAAVLRSLIVFGEIPMELRKVIIGKGVIKHDMNLIQSSLGNYLREPRILDFTPPAPQEVMSAISEHGVSFGRSPEQHELIPTFSALRNVWGKLLSNLPSGLPHRRSLPSTLFSQMYSSCLIENDMSHLAHSSAMGSSTKSSNADNTDSASRQISQSLSRGGFSSGRNALMRGRGRGRGRGRAKA